MKHNYEKPKVEIILFAEEIITANQTSVTGNEGFLDGEGSGIF